MTRLRHLILALAVVGLTVAASHALDDRPSVPPSDQDRSPGMVVAAVGDIGDCEDTGDEAVAQAIRPSTDVIATLGDHAYPAGSWEDFRNCYIPSWGRLKGLIRPSVGNHEYLTPQAEPYFEYFGSAAGPRDRGYYSYDLGPHWHVVVLNSNCEDVAGGCREGSPQEEWLRANLAENLDKNILAYWHHPRFSSGRHGNHPSVRPFWEALHDAGADVVLNAHDHNYQRFGPQDEHGYADPMHGIRQFVVGTGGGPPRDFPRSRRPHTETRHWGGYGYLELTLHRSHYEWEFVATDPGDTFEDTGEWEVSHGLPENSPLRAAE